MFGWAGYFRIHLWGVRAQNSVFFGAAILHLFRLGLPVRKGLQRSSSPQKHRKSCVQSGNVVPTNIEEHPRERKGYATKDVEVPGPVDLILGLPYLHSRHAVDTLRFFCQPSRCTYALGCQASTVGNRPHFYTGIFSIRCAAV